jgi:hypothetical protein
MRPILETIDEILIDSVENGSAGEMFLGITRIALCFGELSCYPACVVRCLGETSLHRLSLFVTSVQVQISGAASISERHICYRGVKLRLILMCRDKSITFVLKVAAGFRADHYVRVIQQRDTLLKAKKESQGERILLSISKI